MAHGWYRAMATSVLSLHAAYIAWVILGAFFTRGRPRLAALHVATLVYGMIIEISGFWCPLAALETWLEVRGNVPAYRGPFLLHYLDAVVYPEPSHRRRCRRLHFESMDLRTASPCPTLSRMKTGHGAASGVGLVERREG
jgi:hypothetical protein